MQAPETLSLSPDRSLAYHKLNAQGDGANQPGVIFLGGFKSDMTGLKATYLEDWSRQRGTGFLRFDYRGHGASSAAFEEGCIGDWADDACEVLQRLTSGPQVLVGSSMGGWIMLLLAKRFPERVAGLVGIAAAPDFTEDGMWHGMTEAQRAELMERGRIERPSEYSEEPYVITRRLIEDGREHLVLREALDLACPVRLLHGLEDIDVPISVALRLIEHMECADARLTLVKGADHRFSEPENLTLLGKTLHGVLKSSS
ncbi:MAG: alpha/beta hydrolase [Pseudomonadota bacterium]